MFIVNKRYFLGLIALSFFHISFSMQVIKNRNIEQIREDIISDLILKRRVSFNSVKELKNNIKGKRLKELKDAIFDLSTVKKEKLKFCRQVKLIKVKKRLLCKIVKQRLTEELSAIKGSVNVLMRRGYRYISHSQPSVWERPKIKNFFDNNHPMSTIVQRGRATKYKQK
ncbi:hypothetical protein ACFLYU_05410 [Candidatus Dependentiae bacterium]